jgi:hypothetical protein
MITRAPISTTGQTGHVATQNTCRYLTASAGLGTLAPAQPGRDDA